MNGTSIHVLLIEGNSDDANFLRRLLSQIRQPSFTLVHARLLAEGLACLQTQHVDIVLLDLILPDSIGIEGAQKLRKHAGRIPIIVLTGLDDEELALKTLQLDVQDYLIKGLLNKYSLKRAIRYAIERKHATEDMQNSEARFRTFFEMAGAGAAEVDPATGGFMKVNDRFCTITGYSREELLTMTFRDITHPDDQEADKSNFKLLVNGELSIQREEKRYIRKGGQVVWVYVSGAVVRDAGGKPVRAIGIIQDITEQKKAEQALRFSEERFKFTMDAAELGVWDMNLSDRSIWRSRRYDQIFGYAEPLPRWNADAFLEHVLPEDREAVDRNLQEALTGTQECNIECRIRRADGAVCWIWVRGRIADGEAGQKRMLGIVLDITRHKQLEDDIKHMAQHDVLTGLPNRRLFQEIIAVEAADAKRYGKKLAILFLDLDHFKDVNDTLGHEAGDELLKEAAEKIRSTIRGSDTLARIGGDEFNVLLADFSQIGDISDVVGKIADCFRSPFLVAGQEVTVTASIGVSIYPDDSEEIDSLLRYADRAMYRAKEWGRNTYQFYNAMNTAGPSERMKLEKRLRQSLARKEMVVYYQPQLNLETRRMESAEALVRWRHPDLGILEPKEFIQAARDTGYISDIDAWVLKNVCEQLKTWRDAGLPEIRITVNVSARGFHSPGFVNTVRDIIAKTGVPASSLSLEITESMAMSNLDRSISRANELVALGVHLSIDDFGTGNSLMMNLRKLSIDKLQIDKSFVQNIATDADDRAIVNAVTSMARSMSIRTVAEGVETKDQLERLHEAGCQEIQGYLFSKPLPADAFERFMGTGITPFNAAA